MQYLRRLCDGISGTEVSNYGSFISIVTTIFNFFNFNSVSRGHGTVCKVTYTSDYFITSTKLQLPEVVVSMN